MTPRPIALVREVPDSFRDCLVTAESRPEIDVAAAREQHLGYRAALEAGGFAVRVVAGDPAHPDSPFIEDTAVVIEDRALITHPGHPSRRGEPEAVAAVLGDLVAITRMEAPATLDGGDVLQVGRTVFVGRSTRTNTAGITALGRFAAAADRSVIPVEVEGVLHLKSAVTALDPETLIAAPGVAGLPAFAGLRVLPVAPGDPEAANVVRLPDGRLIVADHHDATERLLAAAGYGVVRVDVGEFAKADGGLTCLSLRLRDVMSS